MPCSHVLSRAKIIRFLSILLLMQHNAKNKNSKCPSFVINLLKLG